MEHKLILRHSKSPCHGAQTTFKTFDAVLPCEFNIIYVKKYERFNSMYYYELTLRTFNIVGIRYVSKLAAT